MPPVQVERRGSVALLTLNRPETFNGFDPPMARALRAAVAAAAGDPAVGAVVLTGAGKAFCAGGDIQAMAASREPAAVFEALTAEFHPAILDLATMPKPCIAAVNGAAAGGGFSLALACDLRLAGDRAKFKVGYLDLGVVPDGGFTWFAPRLLGPARARALLFEDEPVTAARALELGLVDRVVPPEQLLPEALALAARLAARPRFATGKAKQLLMQGQTADLERHLAEERRWNAHSATLPDLAEGLEAFAGKRPPRFPSARGQG